MKRTRKIVASIICIILSLSLMIIGVLSVNNQSLLINGTLSTTIQNENDILIDTTVWYKVGDGEYQKIGTKTVGSDFKSFDNDIDMGKDMIVIYKIEMTNYGKAANLNIVISDIDDTQFSDNFDVRGSYEESFAEPIVFTKQFQEEPGELMDFRNGEMIYLEAGFEEETRALFFVEFQLKESKKLELNYSMLLSFDEAMEEGYNYITFDSNGGSSVAKIKAKSGATISSPADPDKNGYDFDGWYSDMELMDLYEFTIMPEENIKLYAKWQAIIYSITYTNLLGGINPNVAIDQYTIETETIIFENPTGREGFIGSWNLASIPKGSTGNKIISAIWQSLTDVYFEFDEMTETITGLSGAGKLASEIIIPAKINGVDVTIIGDHAFENCFNLVSVTIPESIEIIGNYAFFGCSKLSTISIPESVITIGNSAFRETALVNLVIPNSVVSIGNSAFRDCTGLIYVNFLKSISTIGNYAFSGCISLTSIVIPNNIHSIGTYAFQNCSTLRVVYLNRTSSEGITTLANNAVFNGCHPSLGFYLEDSDSLSNYKTSLNWTSYADKISLTTAASNFTFSEETGEITALTSTGRNVASVVIPSYINNKEVVAISASVWQSRTNLTSIIIPPSITTLYDGVFSGCTNLVSVFFPHSITQAGASVFTNCSKLTSMPISYNMTEIKTSMYSGCTGLTSVKVPDNIISLDINAFYNCSGLTSVILSANLTSIGNTAFRNCNKITSLIIPNTVTSIGTSAFNGCTALTSIKLSDNLNNLGDNAFQNCNKLTAITIPNGVTSIGVSAFQGCTSLSTVNLSNRINSIGNSAFQSCTSLSMITFPNQLVSIGNSAFQDCTALSSVLLPDSVTSLGDSVFSGCTGMTSLTISTNLITMGNTVFNGCSGLTSVIIPDSVTSLGNSVFNGCTSLETVKISENLGSLGTSVFRDCRGLTSITIPQSIDSIGNTAFYGCTNLVTVYVNRSISSGTITTVGTNSFGNCHESLKFYMSDSGSVTAYKADSTWTTYQDKIYIKP